jgi:hypothetical protein
MISVICTKDGMIKKNYLFTGEDAAKNAEKKFAELCSISYKWPNENNMQKDYIRNGYFEFDYEKYDFYNDSPSAIISNVVCVVQIVRPTVNPT